MEKKKGVFFLLLLMSINFVSAIPYDSDFYFIQDGAQKTILIITNLFGPFFDVILGEYNGPYGDFSQSEIFLIRILVFLILCILIYISVKRIPTLNENKAVIMIITLSVSIIAIRFMSKSQLIFGILLPYGTLGVVITTILPFLIFFYFIHSAGIGTAGRRLSWIFFGIVFVALWISKSSQLTKTVNYIYLAGTGAIFLAFIFDRAIHRYFAIQELNLFVRKSNQKAAASLQAEYLNILNVDSPQASARRIEIEKKLKEFGANIP